MRRFHLNLFNCSKMTHALNNLNIAAPSTQTLFEDDIINDVMNAVDCPMLFIDNDLRVLLMNHSAEDLLDTTVNKLAGKNLRDYCAKGSSSRLSDSLLGCICYQLGSIDRHRITQQWTESFCHSDQTNTSRYLIKATAVCHQSQHVGFTITITDLTQQAKSESNQCARSLRKESFDCSREPVIRFDSSLSVIGMNICARRIFIDSITAYTENKQDTIIRITHRYTSKQLIAEALEKLKQNECLEIKVFTQSGEKTYYDVSASIFEIDDQITYATHFHDITARKQHEIKLRAELRRARKNNEAKSTFLAVMSHEMRTPLIGILGTHEILQDTNLSEEQARYLEIASSSSHSLLNLINGILDFSKIEAGKIELEMIDFNPEDIVNQVVEILATTAFKKGLSLQAYIDPDIPTRIVSDPVRLHQILVNLVNNAIKFTGKGGISIVVSKSKIAANQLLFEINDTGIGIPADKLNTIFEDFTQVESSTQRRYGGSGLGLAISSRLVKMLGGELNVSSTLEQGSSFCFTVTYAEAVTSKSFQIPENVKGVRLLLVDNSVTSASILKRQLQSFCMDVTHVHLLSHALDHLCDVNTRDTPYYIVIVNLFKLGGNLNAFCTRLEHYANSHQCCFILVGHPNSIRETKSYHESVFTSAIPLPIRRTTLLQRIQLLLDKGVDDYKPGKHSIKPQLQCQTHTRILITDDSTTNRIVTESMLKRAGYCTFTATNGKEAITMLQQNTIDLVLMDMSMPVMDGIEATIYIRSLPDYKALPIIALTATALQEEIDACKHAGMNDYIGKPFTKQTLLDKISKWTTNLDTEPAPEKQLSDNHKTMHTNTTNNQPTNGTDYIDLSVLSKMSDDLPTDMLQNLINLFVAESAKRLEQIERLLSTKDIEELGNQAHALKGSAATFGATMLTPLAENLEYCCKKGDSQDIQPLAKQVIEVCNQTLDAYRSRYL